jgi:hypothetical protein
MIVPQLLDALRHRVPWSTMRAISKMCNLSIGRGWEDAVKILMAKYKSEDDFDDNFHHLKKLYCDNLLVGEKSVRFFPADRCKIDKMIDFLLSYQVKKTVFHSTYPFPLSQEQLQRVAPSPEIVEIRNCETNLTVILCTKREFTQKSVISPDELGKEAKKELIDYDELIGVKNVPANSLM